MNSRQRRKRNHSYRMADKQAIKTRKLFGWALRRTAEVIERTLNRKLKLTEEGLGVKFEFEDMIRK